MDSSVEVAHDSKDPPKLEVYADPVLNAIKQNNWEDLRQLSLQVGGFRERRKEAWPFLLHVQKGAAAQARAVSLPEAQPRMSRRRRSPSTGNNTVSSKETILDEKEEYVHIPEHTAHPDEHQIKLDTDRSFVIYPVETDVLAEREVLQADLNQLIVSVFRNRPKLSYFQGYHDIITVLFLTLPREDQLTCAEKLSLHRLRDSMGKGLEPVVGLLRIMKHLLRLADSSLAELLERNAPLPYFALSNLLTLFSHDVPTLPQIQHVFDFLLCRPPIISVYLAVAIVLTRKEEAERLEMEGEEGMLHSLMSSLPELTDGEKEDTQLSAVKIQPGDDEEVKQEDPETDTSIVKMEDGEWDTTVQRPIKNEKVEQETDEAVLPVSEIDREKVQPQMKSSIGGENIPPSQPNDLNATLSKAGHLDDASQSLLRERSTDSSFLPYVDDAIKTEDEPINSLAGVSTAQEPGTRSSSPSRPMAPSHRRRQVPLASLLARADELYKLYPPNHPSLAVNSIMGLQSVIFTWSEDANAMEDDATAEAMVMHPELVVLPYVEPDASDTEGEGKQETEKVPPRRQRKRLRKPRRFAIEKRTAVAGAVLVLGVAFAVYGISATGPYSGVLGKAGHGPERHWKKAGRWAGGILLGASERIMGGFGW